ncbi:unnamed protein product [Calypogeia fissa]
MAVYFKFRSAIGFDFVRCDAPCMSVANLKNLIVTKCKLAKLDFFDLILSNAVTNEEYVDEGFLVPKFTSVCVRRVPRPSVPIVVGIEQAPLIHSAKSESQISKSQLRIVKQSSIDGRSVKGESQSPESPLRIVKLQSLVSDGLDDSSHASGFNLNTSRKVVSPPGASTYDDLDGFGDNLYTVPEVVSPPALSRSGSNDNEDEKIKALVESATLEWQWQGLRGEQIAENRRNGSQGQGRSLPLQREYRQGFENKTPPPGYVCHRCGVAGHFIQHCPTNGDPDYNKKKIRPPTGIPRSMLDVDPDGTYFLPTGEVAVMKPNESAFDREAAFLPSSSRQIVDIPPELLCPLCKEVLKDAVLTSKCCFRSYCDHCIRSLIIAKGECVCGASNVVADDLLPNKTLREAIDCLLESSQVSCITSSHSSGHQASVHSESSKYTASSSPKGLLVAASGKKGGVEPSRKKEEPVKGNKLRLKRLREEETMQPGHATRPRLNHWENHPGVVRPVTIT